GRAEVLNDLGVLQARAGRLSEARQSFEQALRTHPVIATAYDNLREVYGQQAAKAYAQALQQPWMVPTASQTWRLAPSAAQPSADSTAAGADLPRPAALAPLGEQAGTQGLAAADSPAGPTMEAPAPALASLEPLWAADWRERWPSVERWISQLPSHPGSSGTGRTGAPHIPAVGMALAGSAQGSGAPASQAGGTGWNLTLGRLASASLIIAMFVVLALASLQTQAARSRGGDAGEPRREGSTVNPLQQSSEARLIEIYRRIGAADLGGALAHAEALVNDNPSFQLAQLVYGDLLMAQASGLDGFGAGATRKGGGAATQVSQLQQEAVKRLNALRTPPPQGSIPSAFVQLAPGTRHAVAVDATQSRLYVFENRASGLVLASHHYIATGRQGLGKRREGDLRTPLGVYFITGRLDARDLDDFYGVGALPLNYPNEHDRQRGRTGNDIWLHGTPASQYAPLPDSSNGCIVLGNNDLRQLWRELAPMHTPVVVARHLDWVAPASLVTQRRELLAVLDSWRLARSAADLPRSLAFLAKDYRLGDASPADSRRALERELGHGKKERELRDVTVLSWQDEGDRAVITFTEVVRGSRKQAVHRQYWNHEQGHWKLYSEGVIE
ncbi:MAG: hypothetical protein RL722_1670, partial [Pseudomonadota bacterium]